MTLSPGTNTLSVRTIDAAANTTTGIGHSYTLDTEAPTAIAMVTVLSADTGTVGDFVTSVASQTVSGTFTGTLGAGEKIQVSANGTTWVRLSIDVDVEVEAEQIEAARRAEAGAQAGDMNAAQEVMNLALEWLSTAMYDKHSRDWQSFDWALVEDCDPDDFPAA